MAGELKTKERRRLTTEAPNPLRALPPTTAVLLDILTRVPFGNTSWRLATMTPQPFRAFPSSTAERLRVARVPLIRTTWFTSSTPLPSFTHKPTTASRMFIAWMPFFNTAPLRHSRFRYGNDTRLRNTWRNGTCDTITDTILRVTRDRHKFSRIGQIGGSRGTPTVREITARVAQLRAITDAVVITIQLAELLCPAIAGGGEIPAKSIHVAIASHTPDMADLLAG